MFFFDPVYFLFLAPAILLMGWAQLKVRSTFQEASRVPASLSGAATARYILDRAGCSDVEIEQVHGTLTDHYDPSARVLRLSENVYHDRSAAAVGIAAHEAGHALQHASHYLPLAVRNAAVPAAQAGPVAFMVLLTLGFLLASTKLILLGIAAYGAVLVFQLVNLPVEFDASRRAKRLVSELNIVDEQGAIAVSSVLNAAAWTYVAATLQTLLTVLYYLMRFGGLAQDD